MIDTTKRINPEFGMSTRLLLAGMAMQGLLATTGMGISAENIAQSALIYADELLKQESK